MSDELDELVDSVGEVLHRRGWDLSEDKDAALVRDTVEATARIAQAPLRVDVCRCPVAGHPAHEPPAAVVASLARCAGCGGPLQSSEECATSGLCLYCLHGAP